jgi:hypothetical protein
VVVVVVVVSAPPTLTDSPLNTNTAITAKGLRRIGKNYFVT